MVTDAMKSDNIAVIPESLYYEFKIEVITVVSLVSGGVVSLILVRPWHNIPQFDVGSISALSVAIISGGILAYFVYGIAIKNIGASKSSLLACSEIVVATVVSAIWLGNKFLLIDVVGFMMIASTVFLLTVQRNKDNRFDKKRDGEKMDYLSYNVSVN